MAEIDLRAFGGLEHDVKHLARRLDDLERVIGRLENRIAQLTAVLDQARGARWVVALFTATISFASGVIAAAKGLFN